MMLNLEDLLELGVYRLPCVGWRATFAQYGRKGTWKCCPYVLDFSFFEKMNNKVRE